MRFITAKSETSVADLTRRAFEFKGRNAAERTRHAQAALLHANPHLRDLKKVPAGTLVMVPDLPGASPLAPRAALSLSPDVVAHLKQALAGAQAVLERAAAAEAEASATTLELVKSLGQMGLVKQAPDVQSRLPEIAKRAKARATTAAASTAAQIEALAALATELDQLSP
ncbi:MAG TPA: hypothetical protein VLW52_00720 [Opitutaceae bacterium]|nr:hypothetical protein [Opitutaceae bacterium]